MFFHFYLYLFYVLILMHVVVYNLGFGRTDGGGEVVEGLELDLFHGTETQEQLVGGFLTDAGDVGEGGAEGAFGAFVAVEGDGEAVHLVLDLLQEVEEGVGGFETYNFYLGRF